MKRVLLVVVCAALAGGCKDDKPDNSKVQTPADAPIGCAEERRRSAGPGQGPGGAAEPVTGRRAGGVSPWILAPRP